MAEFRAKLTKPKRQWIRPRKPPTEFHRPMPAFISKRFCKSLFYNDDMGKTRVVAPIAPSQDGVVGDREASLSTSATESAHGLPSWFDEEAMKALQDIYRSGALQEHGGRLATRARAIRCISDKFQGQTPVYLGIIVRTMRLQVKVTWPFPDVILTMWIVRSYSRKPIPHPRRLRYFTLT